MKKKCVTEVFSRVTGFFRPTKVWNPGKKEEFKDRKRYKIEKGAGHDTQRLGRAPGKAREVGQES